ncbi:MAG TPA: DUF1775 domain-containing protein [Candidatus Binatia bacterium]|nr:DUF1775 domain-containing protein [Candidatus Binatia bacterium]
MINKLWKVVGVGVVTFFMAAGTAMAHVIVTPSTVGVAAFQTFSVSVPTEKDTPTTALKLLIPSGLNEVTPTVKPGWQIDTKKSGDTVTEIDWTGGSIPVGLRDDFTFNAEAPANATELHWKAYQTYGDGSVVSWDATPSGSDDATGDQGPYSITKVVNDLGTSTTTSSTSSNTLAYAISTAALAIAFVALVRSMMTKRR